jgi:translation initiation factor 3 subunit B
LGDAAGRDQYLTFRDQDVNVFWNGRNGNAEPVRGPDGKPIKNSVSDCSSSQNMLHMHRDPR